MTKHTLYMMLLLVTLGSCRKDREDEIEAVAPPVNAQFSRSFNYPQDRVVVGVNYPNSDVQAEGLLNADGAMVLNFTTPPAAGPDHINLMIPRQSLKPGITGEYAIEETSSSPVKVTYLYRLTESSSNRFFPGSSKGKLTISAYDSKFNTVEGEYSFTINSMNDPASASTSAFRETVVAVAGNFKNLPLK
jgi:hypothetical protein